MTFKQLFEHLKIYVENPEWRWRHCVRVKRGLLNPNDIGGYGKDQCYFEGIVHVHVVYVLYVVYVLFIKNGNF